MSKPIIFLTGATGFLGTQIARYILQNDEAELYALLRASDLYSSEQRLRREWWDWPDLRDSVGKSVHVIPGDITLPHLGIDEIFFNDLAKRVTHIIHAAADIRLFESIEVLRQINVEGTRHLLEFADVVQKSHGLTRLSHVSTAYVAGARINDVPEEELSDRYGFSNPYEQSKYESEYLVRQAANHLPVSIFRPGIIVGDSQTGAVKTFNTLYFPLRLYLTKRISIIPASPSIRVNLVPVDYVSQAIVRLTFEPQAVGLTFHLTPPIEDQPGLSEITQFVRQWAHRKMGLRLPQVRFLPSLNLTKFIGGIAKRMGKDIENLARMLPYFQKQPNFLRQNTDRLLGPYQHRWQSILPPLLAYAVCYSFWHRSTRTVHEQILYRLQSSHKPIKFHDLVENQDHLRSPHEIQAEIYSLISSFHQAGISPGDRIAIVGLNSTRYFSSIVACGIYGAVSVPLYTTCPLAEMEHLLADSQAKLFLIGAPKILAEVEKIRFSGTIISFCRKNIQTDGQRPYLNWEEFLALGRNCHYFPPPIALDAPAALFYTSGTTGEPKGVLFQHQQLRWLGETLAAMYPWQERNRWGSYLSYLPMNHVVEGILASYSPYYVPAALDIYYLEEFDGLQKALVCTNPTIFFSVPRFFEKVRATVMESPVYVIYQSLPVGDFGRKVLYALLHHGLLQKSGLRKTRMLIVGSAPSDPAVMKFFKEFGIEIHDAYGLTEAPLITLNRLNRNKIGSLGEALPDTDIKIDIDGEILVHGPQVAMGYIENGSIEPFTGGWLKTGDLGWLDDEGYLILNGRKKDMIVTSYAKNIFPAPIESRLRRIQGVAEVMLVGEGRPFCAALIWMEPNSWNNARAGEIDAKIAEINSHLSHPEQIKRWAVLPGSLTIASGDLTGSMKIKRGLVAARMNNIIDALYRSENPPGVFYCGGLRRDQ